MRLLPLALLLAASLLTGPPPGVSASETPVIRYPAAADFKVIEFYPGGPRGADGDTAFTRIYGDGRVHVHRPSFHRESGDFEAWLRLPDLESLLRYLDAEGVLAFDLEAVKKQRVDAELAQLDETGSVPGIADAPRTTLTIRLEEYAPAGGAETTSDYWKTISWYALDQDVEWYPEIEPLVRLQRAVSRLRDLRDNTIAAARSGETIVALPAPRGD